MSVVIAIADRICACTRRDGHRVRQGTQIHTCACTTTEQTHEGAINTCAHTSARTCTHLHALVQTSMRMHMYKCAFVCPHMPPTSHGMHTSGTHRLFEVASLEPRVRQVSARLKTTVDRSADGGRESLIHGMGKRALAPANPFADDSLVDEEFWPNAY